MLSETLAELREQAKAAGIPWRWVCERKEELLEIEARKRWAEVSARQVGWWSYVGWTSGSAPFWRHGFRARFGQRLQNAGRITRSSPATISSPNRSAATCRLYEEWSIDEIWELLLSDYMPWPPREKFYADALDDILSAVAQPCETTTSEDF